MHEGPQFSTLPSRCLIVPGAWTHRMTICRKPICARGGALLTDDALVPTTPLHPIRQYRKMVMSTLSKNAATAQESSRRAERLPSERTCGARRAEYALAHPEIPDEVKTI